MKPTHTLAVLALCGGAALGGAANAKLPPPTPEAKAKADETAARNAWNDTLAAYQLCKAQDRIAADYRQRAGRSAPTGLPDCTEPPPFTPPVAARPLEAAGAHSPPATAALPPNTKAPAAELPRPSTKP
jgi:hypothetical protein